MSVSPSYVALRCRCPACGVGKLYDGVLTVTEHCSHCGLALKKHEQGDGPAFFAICIIGTLAGIFATIMEIKFEPPFWLHALVWIPFIFSGSILTLRIAKAALIAVQYQVKREDFSN